ncbi:MAG: hypothetical protein GY718_05645 [Lentisphaerae bacterium]|nr:hypothetical protein [Lentisphaerota bacterium]
MTSDYLGKLWKEIKENLKSTIPAHSYRMWIEPLYKVPSETHGKLVIACANDFAYNRVNGNFLPMIVGLAGDIKVKLVTIKDIPKVRHYLQTWPEDVWGVPAVIIRSSLFSIINRHNERKYFEKEKIASWGKVEIFYTGEQLDQADLEVLMEACGLNSALEIALGEPVPFKRKTFLKEIGKNKDNKKWLLSVFERLQRGQIIIKVDGVTYVISLIQSFMYDDDENS